MTKEEMIEHIAGVVSAVFSAEDKILQTWEPRLKAVRNAGSKEKEETAKAYLRAIAEEIVSSYSGEMIMEKKELDSDLLTKNGSMTDKEITDMGRKHGIAMLRDLKAHGATTGEYIGVASFALQGIILAAGIKSGVDIEVLRKTFNECLDVWFAKEI